MILSWLATLLPQFHYSCLCSSGAEPSYLRFQRLRGSTWELHLQNFFIFAKFGVHETYFLLKIPSLEGRKNHMLMICYCHSVKRKIDYEGSQMMGYKSNPLGLLVEGVKREEDEQKGWGAGDSSMESQQQCKNSWLSPEVKGWVDIEDNELHSSPPVWPWVFIPPDLIWHMPTPA